MTKLVHPCALGLAALAWAASAGAIDLEGLWQGTITCQEFDGVVTKTKDRAGALDIIHPDGATFAAELNGIRAFNGSVVPSARDGVTGGEAVMSGCDTDAFPIDGQPGEVIHLRAKVNPAKGTGTLTGTGIYESGSGAGAPIRVCKYKLKRTSTTPGAFTKGCPP
jgi:hypothetical protein